jgi:hypothetical protein
MFVDVVHVRTIRSNASMKNRTVYHEGDGVLRDHVMLWPVWMEGYCVTGNRMTAQFMGQFFGTWAEAVEKAIKSKTDQLEGYWDADKLTYWGCRFYDNEEAARKSFG